MGQSTPMIFGPIADAIQRSVERHLTSGHILSAPDVAADILQTLPGTGVDAERLADQIMITAASAGVPVRIGDYRPEDISNSDALWSPRNQSAPEV